MVAELPSQHITERAFWESAKGYDTDSPRSEPLEPPPVRSSIGGPSRLVFLVPAGEEIPYTVEGLLDACSRLDLARRRERTSSGEEEAADRLVARRGPDLRGDLQERASADKP